jgi:hypothetical protein
LLHEKIDREREILKLTEAVKMLTKLLEQSATGARESDAEADGRHNARLLTSWRDVISHSPRGIACFDGTLLIRRTTASRVVRDEVPFTRRRRKSAMVTRGFTGRQSGSQLSDRIPRGQCVVDNFPVLTAGPTTRIEPADSIFTLKVGPRPVKAWNWLEWSGLRTCFQ